MIRRLADRAIVFALAIVIAAIGVVYLTTDTREIDRQIVIARVAIVRSVAP